MGHPAPGPGQEARPVWILALDASLARCSAALLADGEVRAHRLLDGGRGHAATLPPMVQAVLREAGVAAADLDAVAAVVGPGGFTGIRAALALAAGHRRSAAGLPALGVTTGEALVAALAGRAGRAIWSVVDTRRGRVVLERFAAGAGDRRGPARGLRHRGPAAAGRPRHPGRRRRRGGRRGAGGARRRRWWWASSRQPDAAAAARVAALRLAGRIAAAGGAAALCRAAGGAAAGVTSGWPEAATARRMRAALAALHAAAFPPAEAWGPDAIALMLGAARRPSRSGRPGRASCWPARRAARRRS